MTGLDWTVVAVYPGAMLGLALYLGRRNRSREDYYLGGHRLPGWALASSIVATQCSTNSLLGAPAFVGFVISGGLLGNVLVFFALPELSWLWWNVTGFIGGWTVALGYTLLRPSPAATGAEQAELPGGPALQLGAMFALILAVCLGFQWL